MHTRVTSMIASGTGASRTRIFTATWPTFDSTEVVDGTRVDRKGEDQLQPLRCEVTIRMTPKIPSVVPPSEGGDGPSLAITSHDQLHYDDHTEIVVFAESALLMRHYNSVSLSEGGRYRLTLSECHGIAGSSGSANIASSAPGSTEQSTATGPENIERAGLSFLPVPLSIVFEVDGQVSNGGAVIGNFHLLPVAHIPVLPAERSSLSNVNTETYRRVDSGEDYQQAPTSLSCTSSFKPLQASTSGLECAGELSTGGRSSAGSGCVAGAVIVVFACLLLGWLMYFREWTWKPWETYVNRQGRNLRGEVKRRDVRRAAGKNDARWAIDDGEASDGSSDSDTILNGQVPDPVGLPRSDEDWRALFDTLYENAK